MSYHRDKNGKEIKYARRVLHDSGVKLEPFGTGLKLPPFDGTMTFWRPDEWKHPEREWESPIIFVPTNEVSIDIPIIPKGFWKSFWKWFLTPV